MKRFLGKIKHTGKEEINLSVATPENASGLGTVYERLRTN